VQPKVIRWESMKRKAETEFIGRTSVSSIYCSGHMAMLALHAAAKLPRAQRPCDIMREWQDYGMETIRNWDVRCAMRLAELFPSCLPQYLHGLKPEAGYGEDGEWLLVFDNRKEDVSDERHMHG